MEKKKININVNNIKITFNSGIITNIYSHITNSNNNFYGFLLGQFAIIKNISVSDLNNNQESNILFINIENAIFIYDKKYLQSEKFCYLLEKVAKKYSNESVLGFFSARAYSFPNISLKEQEVYLKSISYIKANSKSYPNHSIPFLFASFVQNVSELNMDNNIPMISFMSRVYSFNESKYVISIN